MKMLFSNEVKQYIRDNAIGVSNKDLTDMVNRNFGTSYTAGQIGSFKSRNHISSGLTGHFEKGHTPFNKGRKGQHYSGCEKTWFKEGHLPAKHRECGSERIDKDGYVLVKVAEPKRWELKHRVVWEQHNGHIPKGSVIIFLDGDKRNFDIGNLRIVSRADLARINQNQLFTDNAEANDTAIVLAKLMTAVGEAKKKGKNHDY